MPQEMCSTPVTAGRVELKTRRFRGARLWQSLGYLILILTYESRRMVGESVLDAMTLEDVVGRKNALVMLCCAVLFL